MNREMTDFALGAKCGAFGTRGESVATGPPWHACGPLGSSAARRPSLFSKSIRASPPMPIPASIQNLRREMNCLFRVWSLMLSIMRVIRLPLYSAALILPMNLGVSFTAVIPSAARDLLLAHLAPARPQQIPRSARGDEPGLR